MSKLIITEMIVRSTPCIISAVEEDNRIVEFHLEPKERTSILGNIYVGQVENIASNIRAAFVQIAPGMRCYFPLDESDSVIYTSGRGGNGPLRPGDEILVQVSRDAMKGKLPALTGNLNFTGKYLVLTTGDKKFGLSNKLSKEDRARLSSWFQEEILQPDKEFGIIVRTNAAEAEKWELQQELAELKETYKKVVINGKQRTCFSLLSETEPLYLADLRDIYSQKLDEIVTDVPQVYERTFSYLKENSLSEQKKLRFYEDKLLPLYKLYRLEIVLEEILREKVWLSSGGFLVIQQTEAFVSIDVNSGKFTGKKKAEETYRKINLEAAREIARQLRLRNLSGIILIDFINLKNPDHQDELFHVFQKYLRQDRVKCKAIDITPLHILEMTRKKVHRPLSEEIAALIDNEI